MNFATVAENFLEGKRDGVQYNLFKTYVPLIKTALFWIIYR